MSSELDHLINASVTVPTKYDAENNFAQQNLNEESSPNKGKASTRQSCINLAKNCIGTGTLALPYACSEGGLALSIFGLALIALWNSYSIDRMIKCAELVELISRAEESSSALRTEKKDISTQERGHFRTLSSKRRHFQTTNHKILIYTDELEKKVCPDDTTTFGKIAFHSFGIWGLHFLDLIMVILFLVVLISFFVLVTTLLEAANFTTGSTVRDTIFVLVTVMLLSAVPDLSFLHYISAAGILAVLIAFIVIFSYGIGRYGLTGFGMIKWRYLWPHDLTGIANFFGIAVFSYAIVPITFNIQESMAKPDQMLLATNAALSFVFLFYIIIGCGVSIIFTSENGNRFEGEVLSHLPSTWISTLVRLAMATTTIATTPFLVIPCSEVITSKLGWGKNSTRTLSVIIRSLICMFSAFMSVIVPDFVWIVKISGSLCISLVGFVFPPLFHIVLVRKYEILAKKQLFYSSSSIEDGNTDMSELSSFTAKYKAVDAIVLILGVIATIVASYLTLQDVK